MSSSTRNPPDAREDVERETPRQGGPLADLRNRVVFPVFDDLPIDNGFDPGFQDFVFGFGQLVKRHWCFLAEIKFHHTHNGTLYMYFKDFDGNVPRLGLGFCTDGQGSEIPSAYVQEGYTIALIYAFCHARETGDYNIQHEFPRMLRDCQRRGWKSNGHKADCKLLRDRNIRDIFYFHWEQFMGTAQFPLLGTE
ncbi:Uu.00g099140.m01.CDS01 [Anthostomella pinea]|uniref:Uu.00g099140.m01.CDS01 n=1 Tax=Anthostomella pinea TaxID=933095 RepID=A0AAI8VCP6_9PEZI|nr:Uu.00g099140.m01.CDS01 [Anthostomella pinea]